ncbi:MAG: C-terminal binding protein [Chloroflexi bacterium]|nr:MAG: C-terminal binding protein [Chloroflexota bacterium]
MARYKVVVSDQVFPTVDVERELLAEIDAGLEVADGTFEGVAGLAADADAILNTYFPVQADLIDRLSRCRIIARYGIGVDNVDLAAAERAGIIVTNVPDYSVEEVAAHAVALILSLLRRIPEADRLTRAGGWGIERLRPIRRISELTFGLVGYGRIARRAADILTALGGRLIAHDPFVAAAPGVPPLVALDELVATSNVISIHAPLTDGTRGLFDAQLLGRMRPDAILVNTSRGPLVVLDDLLAALRDGRLAAAALDVFDREPLDPSRIEGVPNLLVTPHMAYYSEESLAESQRKAATQVIKVLMGEEPDYPVRR